MDSCPSETHLPLSLHEVHAGRSWSKDQQLDQPATHFQKLLLQCHAFLMATAIVPFCVVVSVRMCFILCVRVCLSVYVCVCVCVRVSKCVLLLHVCLSV